MAVQYRCKSRDRRERVRVARRDDKPIINGIDFLEVASTDQKTLLIRFLHNLPGSLSDPIPPAPELKPENIVITGGERVAAVHVLSAERTSDRELTVNVDNPGDFSIYSLHLITSKDNPEPPGGFDPLLSEIEFSFKVECSNEFDCKSGEVCPPDPIPAPEINYLAKDYASFRQVMLDRLAVLMPEWKERNKADLGIALIELLAYVGDYLSYRQDAVATEAYLGTARHRISIRRHARLVDYFMHDGCNARAWVQIQVTKDVVKIWPGDPPRLPSGTKLLTRIKNLEIRIPSDSILYHQAVNSGSEVFETMAPVDELYLSHNKLHFYTWEEKECCLPRGATHVTLKGNYPNLKIGDVMIFMEIRNPVTGETDDADPACRHAVRLIRVITKDREGNDLTDPLNGQLITKIEWHIEDSLPFPFCISSVSDRDHGRKEISDISIALGNIVLADQGRTINKPESIGIMPRPTLRRTHVNDTDNTVQWVPPRFNPQLKEGPLTHVVPYPYGKDDDQLGSAQRAMHRDIRDARAGVTQLIGTLGTDNTLWELKQDLLNSDSNDTDFVVEIETDGRAYIRFGDDKYGSRPASDTRFTAIYRVGNGARGNIGAEALAHIVTDIYDISGVSNLLPAQGGIEPESIEQVRQSAPNAFRTQERAVTTADYEEVTCRYQDVQRAAAKLRWTGSWHTVFVTVDRYGGAKVDDAFETEMRSHLESFRMTGHDIEIDNPLLVPLEIEMHVCVQPDYFVSDVKKALLEVFCNRALSDGRIGIFHPDNFTFGKPVHSSLLYAAAEDVEGVASVKIAAFQRQGMPSDEALKSGKLMLGRFEIACLDNDPNFPGRGVFRLKLEGGK